MNQELQNKISEFQMLDQELRQMEKQIVMIQNQIFELRLLHQNLDELKDIKQNTEMFSPIGAGIFIKTKLEDAEKVLMNIGADTAVIKTREEAKEILKNQIGQMNLILNQMQAEFQKIAIQMQSLEKELQKEIKE